MSHVLSNGAIFVRGLGFPPADWCFRGCLTELLLGVSANELALEDSCEGGGWDWEPWNVARPPHCSLPLRTNRTVSVEAGWLTKRVHLGLLDAEFCSNNSQQCQVDETEGLTSLRRRLGF
jgi:hypothetical protein